MSFVTRCPVCKMALQPSEPVTACQQCHTTHHTACWQVSRGCSIYGCEGGTAVERSPLPANLRTGWGDDKLCPNCRNELPASALSCSCGAKFPWSDPITPQAYQEWTTYEHGRRVKRTALCTMFLLSMTGLAAPMAGLAAIVSTTRWRRELAGDYGAYLALGYGTAAIGAVYCAIFTGLWLGF